MWLLALDLNGSFKLTEFLGDDIPQYAILSHTWGADSDEVHFRDLVEGTGKNKPGYDKIKFCEKHATKDGLRYFWVDTCCIDKSSSAELQEAITSMFCWYRNAAKCYVYMSDVLVPGDENSQISPPAWEPDFRKSRWFTRGWTLQELIAPAVVEFFSSEGKRLGSKISLERQVHEITGIPVRALRGNPLSHFSVDERMSWAAKRKTKRKEDEAYCLLGIFDIHMPLIYGEGAKALNRLQKEIRASKDESFTQSSTILPTAPLNPQRDRPLVARSSFSTVPFKRDADFVDRDNILDRVGDKCSQAAGRVALVGLGGVGKSQLAIEYSYRLREKSPETWVFWVHASNAARFEEAYKNIADRLELPGRENPTANVLQLVYNWLCSESSGRWIIIVDNADDGSIFYPKQDAGGTTDLATEGNSRTSLAKFIPQSQNGSVLITSRRVDVAIRLTGSPKDIIQIQGMDEAQGVQLLLNKLLDIPEDKAELSQLVYALDCLPLAITQAAAYINQRSPRMSVPKYLQEIKKSDQKKEQVLTESVSQLSRDEFASNSILITWQVSFEWIQQERPSAAELLSFMSFFNQQGIPEYMLRYYLPEVEATDKDSESNFEEDLVVLRSYSLVTMSSNGDMFGMHPLVQFATRRWLRSSHVEDRWRSKFLAAMSKELPNGKFHNWAKCQELFSHVEAIIEKEPEEHKALMNWSRILANAAWYAMTQGLYEPAEIMAKKSVAGREKSIGPANTSTLISMGVLALILRYQGKYKEAEQMTRRVLEVRRKLLGKEHPHTLKSMNNLASVLYCQGKYQEAEEIHRQVLKGREKQLGKMHADTLSSMHNLSSTLIDQRKYEEAEEINQQVLEERERVLGREHPDTLNSLHNLASLLLDQGKYKRAEELNQQVQEGREKVLGKEHPDTLSSMHNRASSLYKQGRHKEATEMFQQVLDKRERVLGKNHPQTKDCEEWLVAIYREKK